MFILYHTQGCHLCEQAMALYGTRIPVLENEQGQYLDWPFDYYKIEKFLSPNKRE